MGASQPSSALRDHARMIWQAAVAAVDPFRLVREALTEPAAAVRAALNRAARVVVVGGGKAGAAMAAGVEAALADRLDRVVGLVNVPATPCATAVSAVLGRPNTADTAVAHRRIRLHAARPAGVNHPTAAGVAGVQEMLDLVQTVEPGDVGLCLLSGGGSALLPAPVEGVTLEDKQRVTALLHACGATINEMNCVRKHLSRVKGGRLAQAFLARRCPLFSLIVSDVIGDPLDVIASGPTAADPTTFADALAVLQRYHLSDRTPPAVLDHLRRGQAGAAPETLKTPPDTVHHLILGNNSRALAAAKRQAEQLGYPVMNLGSYIDGETQHVAAVFAGIVRSIRADGQPLRPPVCLLSGGETTVTLPADHGRGGRNQEFVLAAAIELGGNGLRDVAVLSGGTDGEDGPTDAAGAVADGETLARAGALGLDPAAFLARHDAYAFFEATGGLLKTGLTQTNVMDVRLLLVGA